MMHKKKRSAMAILAVTAMLGTNAAAQPAFPGAVGFGVHTPAGRGGKIIRVTNLDESGEGSLKACVNASGPRICVFEVSGIIRLTSNLVIENPKITIAGQTAPAPGIMLRGAALQITTSDVLVQHIAVRSGDAADGPPYDARDSLKIVGNDDPISGIVIDHCSFSWGIDENVEVYRAWSNITISNTIISEPLRNSLHSKGPHGLGVLINSNREGSRISLIGNLIAHSHGRNPRSNAPELVLVNNVVYNARDAETMLFNDHGLTSDSTVVGNVYINGPSTQDFVKPVKLIGETAWEIGTQLLSGSKIYLADNDSRSATDDPWSVVDNHSLVGRSLLEASDILSWPSGFEALPSADVVDHVLTYAGTRPGQRNGVDERVIKDVRNRTGRIVNCVRGDGTSRCSSNAGGWPQLAENTRRLTIPADPHVDDDGDGYTRVEEWLHAMAAEVEGRSVADAPEQPGSPTPALARPNPPDLRP